MLAHFLFSSTSLAYYSIEQDSIFQLLGTESTDNETVPSIAIRNRVAISAGCVESHNQDDASH